MRLYLHLTKGFTLEDELFWRNIEVDTRSKDNPLKNIKRQVSGILARGFYDNGRGDEPGIVHVSGVWSKFDGMTHKDIAVCRLDSITEAKKPVWCHSWRVFLTSERV